MSELFLLAGMSSEGKPTEPFHNAACLISDVALFNVLLSVVA